jgi:hypothetical protein
VTSAATARRELGEARAVIDFNEKHLVGTKVRYWKGAKRGEPNGESCTVGPASLVGGSGVVWLDGVSGCIALSHVEVVTKPVAVEVPAGWTAAGGSS